MASVVHYSTKIEGNRLTREQVEAIIAGESIEAPEKDKIEAQNYHQAMQWCRARADDADWKLTHETILTLHFMIGQNLGADYEPLGKYRQAQNNVADRNSGVAIYWPPRPENVRPLMDELVNTVRRHSASHIDPYIANAILHLNFAAIHPFSDGNGRVDRVLCSLLMMHEGYRAQAFYSLEEYFGKNWAEYGQQFRNALGTKWPDHPDQSNCTEWVEWYLSSVRTEVIEAADAFDREVASLGVVLVGMVLAGYKVDRRAIAVWLSIREGKVTNRRYRTIANIEPRTATQDFGELVKSDHLVQSGGRRASHYLPGPTVSAWGDFRELASLMMNHDGVAVRKRMENAMEVEEPTLF